jgi:L-malate glycosyltransferase
MAALASVNQPRSEPTRAQSAPLSIFVAHPSSLLTDHRPHGDGLLAYRFITELASRGHHLHVAAERADLRSAPLANVEIHELGAVGAGEPLARVRYMHRMRQLFDCVHRTTRLELVHQLNPVHVGISLALIDAGLPVVLGPYVPDWPDRSSGLSLAAAVRRRGSDLARGALAALQQRQAAALLLSSPAAAAKLHPRTPLAGVYELPYGIDADVWIPKPERQPRQEILFVGRLHRHKGIFELLDAFERISRRFPAARLTVVGAGPAAEELERRASTGSARSSVRLLGSLDRAATIEVVRDCDVFCLPSHSEPFGLGALEAMACAKAVVATRAGGLEHLVDEAGGCKVAPGDVPALAAALETLLAEPELRRRMGEHNRRRVQSRYTWSRVVDQLERIYAETLARR